MKLCIVGCGKMGGVLSYLISIKNLDNGEIQSIYLIDNDIIQEPKNNFTSLIFRDYTGFPKSYVLSHELDKNIPSNIEYKSFYEDYNIVFPECDNFKGFIKLDCRDDSTEDPRFNFKLCCDGEFGRVIINPEEIEGSPSRYMFKGSIYCSMKMSMIFINDFLFDSPIIDKREEYLIDLKENKTYIVEE